MTQNSLISNSYHQVRNQNHQIWSLLQLTQKLRRTAVALFIALTRMYSSVIYCAKQPYCNATNSNVASLKVLWSEGSYFRRSFTGKILMRWTAVDTKVDQPQEASTISSALQLHCEDAAKWCFILFFSCSIFLKLQYWLASWEQKVFWSFDQHLVKLTAVICWGLLLSYSYHIKLSILLLENSLLVNSEN